ncbi:MAG: hypothetical protein R2873_00375 [Caldilineaceae bacterium]
MTVAKPIAMIVTVLVALSAFVVGRVSHLTRLLSGQHEAVVQIEPYADVSRLSGVLSLEEPLDLGLYAVTISPLRSQLIRIEPPLAADSVDRLRFWVHGGVDGGQLVRVFVADQQSEDVRWIVAADGWTLFEIPIAGLAPPEQLEAVVFEILADGAQADVYVDRIEFVLR